MIYINKKRKTQNKIKKAFTPVNLFLVLLALLIFLPGIFTDIVSNTSEKVNYSTFVDMVSEGKIKDIIIENDKSYISGVTEDGKSVKTSNPNTEESKNLIYNSGANVVVKSSFMDYFSSIFNVLWIVLGGVIIISLLSSATKGGGIGKSMFNEGLDTESKKSNVTFKDVAGNEESKDSMEELISYLSNPEKFKKYGVKPPKGALLFGPPGTGKTLLAKAVAGEANANFLAVSGSDFVDKFVGNGASRVRRLFEEARKLQPCIIFIDEIDAVGGKRSEGIGNDERHQTLNALLSEIDGFSKDDCIIVIGATNRVDSLDSALVRSGRFNTKIHVGLPDLKARKAIFKVHSEGKPIAESVDFDVLAKITTYFSGADIDNVMNKAGFYAAKEDKEFIDMDDIDKAISNLIAGDSKKDRSGISDKDKKLTAYHEAGHAIIAKLVAKSGVPKITIIPTTHGVGGYTQIDNGESSYKSKSEIIAEISTALGGRAAEELIFGPENVTTGASSDIKRATELAHHLNCSYGMNSKFGMLYLAESKGLEAEILNESRLLIESIYNDTLNCLKDNIDLLHKLASKLLEDETVFERDFDAMLNPISEIDMLKEKEE